MGKWTIVGFIAGLLAATPVRAQAPDLDTPAPAPEHVAPSWDRAEVYLPGRETLHGSRMESPEIQAALAALATEGRKLPVIIHMHGCGGIAPDTRKDAVYWSHRGYMVVMPASFARSRPASCDSQAKKGGLFPEVVVYRQQEIAHAVERLRQLPMVDQRNLFLMGHSEGCVAVALNNNSAFNAYVGSGCQCRSALYPTAGVRIPKDKPFFIYRAANDPWYKAAAGQNNCQPFMEGRPEGSASLILPGDTHWMSDEPTIRAAIQALFDRYTVR